MRYLHSIQKLVLLVVVVSTAGGIFTASASSNEPPPQYLELGLDNLGATLTSHPWTCILLYDPWDERETYEQSMILEGLAQRYAVQQQPQQQQIIRPDPKAETWAERNTWFGQDEAMTFAAFGIHKKLIEEEGFDPQTDEYYSELDQRLRKRFPQEFASTPANDSGSSRRPVQTVAGVSRSSQITGRGANAKVRLTPTQVAIAKKLGVPLDHYARYVKD